MIIPLARTTHDFDYSSNSDIALKQYDKHGQYDDARLYLSKIGLGQSTSGLIEDSFTEGQRGGIANKAFRAGVLKYKDLFNESKGDKMSKDDANDTYGIKDGDKWLLQFDADISEDAAKYKWENKMKELEYGSIAQAATERSKFNYIPIFAGNFLGNSTDIGELTLGYITGGLSSMKYARMIGKSIQSAKTRAIATAAVLSPVESLAAEPFHHMLSSYLGEEYTWKDTAINAAFAMGLGTSIAGLRSVVGDVDDLSNLSRDKIHQVIESKYAAFTELDGRKDMSGVMASDDPEAVYKSVAMEVEADVGDAIAKIEAEYGRKLTPEEREYHEKIEREESIKNRINSSLAAAEAKYYNGLKAGTPEGESVEVDVTNYTTPEASKASDDSIANPIIDNDLAADGIEIKEVSPEADMTVRTTPPETPTNRYAKTEPEAEKPKTTQDYIVYTKVAIDTIREFFPSTKIEILAEDSNNIGWYDRGNDTIYLNPVLLNSKERVARMVAEEAMVHNGLKRLYKSKKKWKRLVKQVKRSHQKDLDIARQRMIDEGYSKSQYDNEDIVIEEWLGDRAVDVGAVSPEIMATLKNDWRNLLGKAVEDGDMTTADEIIYKSMLKMREKRLDSVLSNAGRLEEFTEEETKIDTELGTRQIEAERRREATDKKVDELTRKTRAAEKRKESDEKISAYKKQLAAAEKRREEALKKVDQIKSQRGELDAVREARGRKEQLRKMRKSEERRYAKVSDEEYLKAVKSGDIESAKRMVVDAARHSGFMPRVVYHGTNNKFTVFNKEGRNNFPDVANNLEDAHFFTDIEDVAKNFGDKTMPVFLKMGNNIEEVVLDYGKGEWDSALNNLLISEGILDDKGIQTGVKRDFDSITLYMENENQFGDDQELPSIYVVFSPERIKSAEPITYDAEGNIIPLSVRFNQYSKDIRYAKIDPKQAEAERAEARESLRDLKAQLTAKVLDDYTLRKSELEKTPDTVTLQVRVGDTEKSFTIDASRKLNAIQDLKILSQNLRALADVPHQDRYRALLNITDYRISNQSEYIKWKYQKQLIEGLSDKHSKFFDTESNVEEYYRAARGQSKDKDAIEVHNIIQGIFKGLIREHNLAGGRMAFLKDHAIPRVYSSKKILDHFGDKKLGRIQKSDELHKVYKERFIDWYKGKLDLKRMGELEGKGEMTWEEAKIKLGAMFDAIMEEGANSLDPIANSRNLATKSEVSRKIHFKRAEDDYEHDQLFGSEETLTAIKNQIEQLSATTAIYRNLGTNPRNMIDKLVDASKDMAGKERQNTKNEIEKARTKMEAGLSVVDRSFRPNQAPMWLQQTVQVLKQVSNLAKMGGLIFTSASDISFKRLGLSRLDVDQSQAMKTMFGISKIKTAADKRMLENNMAMVEAMMDTMVSRFDLDNLGQNSKLAKLQHKFFTVNGMNWWNKWQRESFILGAIKRMGANSQYSMKDLEGMGNAQVLLRAMKEQGINADDWDIIRSTAKHIDRDNPDLITPANGRGFDVYLTQDMVQDMDIDLVQKTLKEKGLKWADSKLQVEDYINNLSAKYGGFLREQMDSSILTPGVREKRMANLKQIEGSYPSVMLKMLFQYKTFPLAMMSKVFKYHRHDVGSFVNLLSAIGMATAIQVMAMQAREVISGRTPREVDGSLLWDAFLKSGGGGLAVDLLSSTFSPDHYKVRAEDYIGGPAMNLAFDALNLGSKGLKSIFSEDVDASDVGMEGAKFLKSWTPGNNHPLIKAMITDPIFNMAADHLNPETLERTERWYEKRGQEYMFNSPTDDNIWMEMSDFVFDLN